MVCELAESIKNYSVFVLVHGSEPDTEFAVSAHKRLNIKYLGINGKINIKSFFRVMKAFNAIKPDIVHCHLGVTYLGYLWCLVHRKKCVVTVHTRPEKAFSAKNCKAVKHGLKSGNIDLVAVSRENQRLCNEYFKTDKVKCVNNGVDLARFYRKNHDVYTFINVARQDENKNQGLILRCFARLTAEGFMTKLYLLGDGSLHEELKETAKTLHIEKQVVFTGNVSDVENYYAISDCFLLSSHREALPMTAIEAAAAGLTIISTDVGGMKDIVRENGMLIKDGDEDGFYSAMKDAITQRRNDRERSVNIAREYSSEKMAERYEAIYE